MGYGQSGASMCASPNGSAARSCSPRAPAARASSWNRFASAGTSGSPNVLAIIVQQCHETAGPSSTFPLVILPDRPRKLYLPVWERDSQRGGKALKIIGYGSLLSQASLESTLRRPAALTKTAVTGWRRVFNAE